MINFFVELTFETLLEVFFNLTCWAACTAYFAATALVVWRTNCPSAAALTPTWLHAGLVVGAVAMTVGCAILTWHVHLTAVELLRGYEVLAGGFFLFFGGLSLIAYICYWADTHPTPAPTHRELSRE